MSAEKKTGEEKSASFISEPVRKRLPSYYRMLVRLYADGHMRISSDELAAVMHSTPSQVRGDLLSIGCSGRKGYGYLITKLYNRIGEVMQIQDSYSAVMIGGGSLASVLSGCHLFTKRGVKLVGSFAAECREAALDGNGRECGRYVYDTAEIERFCRETQVDIMILACDAENATALAALAERVGISGIWNFSDTDIKSESLAVRNVHIEDSLMMLCSEIKQK